MRSRTVLSLLLPLAACEGSLVSGSPDAGAAPDSSPFMDASVAEDSAASDDAAPGRDAAGAPDRGAPDAAPPDGSTPDVGRPGGGAGVVDLRVVADEGATSRASGGVPFPMGELFETGALEVRDAGGRSVAFSATVLASWPQDGSVRSVLVAFDPGLGRGEEEAFELRYGDVAGPAPESATPVLDGPGVLLVDPVWIADSRAFGPLQPRADNDRFERFDARVEDELVSMSPAFTSYDVSCRGTSAHRTYYDSPHGIWMLSMRASSPELHRRARAESAWYRANELTWYEGRSLAVQVCEASGWTPSRAINWSVLRRMTSQGMLDDYLMTGDPAAREAVAAMGEAFVQNLPALRGGRENVLRVTERNLAWTLMGVAAYYAIEPSERVRAALDSLVTEAFDWQNDGSSGAFEHDIVRPDPSECSDGPAGGSPFMTSLLVDGLMDAFALTNDARIPGVVTRTAAWLRDDAVTPNGRAFRYLWGCNSNGYEGTSADLNNLIVHVFGAAYEVSGDIAWLEAGDRFADAGMAAIYVGRPKQWSQTVRGFARYLGYRAR
ncbi:MAG: hypothetical protein AAF645_02175 [Myxococcota bacterium]